MSEPLMRWLPPGDSSGAHLVPLVDLREHEPSMHCWCCPVEDEWEPGCWVHAPAGVEKQDEVKRT